jgi:hypothetical protein
MKIYSAKSYIKEWDTKGENLFGQNKSVQPDPDIILTPEHPVDKAFFIVTCSIDIRNFNGNYAMCTAQSHLKFENDKKPPAIEVLYDIVRQAHDNANKLVLDKTKGTDFRFSFHTPSFDEVRHILEAAILKAYPLN